MRVVLQRVTNAKVNIDGNVFSSISKGLLLLVGISNDDNEEDIDYLVRKVICLRIFNDADGIMNLSVKDIDGEILAVSQFTLMASTKKGNRPSYIRAAKHDVSIPLYNRFVECLKTALGKEIATGRFGADMQIELLNDGPVTIIIDSKEKNF